jgi:hypothetical protein
MSVDYEDLTRPTADFFVKPFPASRLVKIGTETRADYLTLKTTAQRSFRDDKELYDLTIEPKLECKEYGTLELKMQTQNVLQATLSRRDIGLSGLKLSLGATQDMSKDKRQQNTLNVGAEFQHEKVFFKATGGFPLEVGARPYPISGNLVVQPVDNVFAGAKFDLKLSTGEKGKFEKEVEFKLAGSRGATRAYVTGTLDSKLGLFVNHNLNSNDTLGLRVSAALPTEEGQATKIAVDLAGQHRICKEFVTQAKLNLTPASDAKSKTGIRFGLGGSWTLPGTSAVGTLAMDINVGEFMGNEGAPHSLGFELKLK